MTLRTETLVYGDVVVAAGTVPASVVATFTEAGGTHVGQTVAIGTTSVVQDLTPGTWVATFQTVDAAGKPIGPVVTDPESIVIAAPATVTVSIPVSATGMTAST